jgi:hypothetical protein
MKPHQIKTKYLEALCDKVDIDATLLDDAYKQFAERMNKIKGG